MEQQQHPYNFPRPLERMHQYYHNDQFYSHSPGQFETNMVTSAQHQHFSPYNIQADWTPSYPSSIKGCPPTPSSFGSNEEDIRRRRSPIPEPNFIGPDEPKIDIGTQTDSTSVRLVFEDALPINITDIKQLVKCSQYISSVNWANVQNALLRSNKEILEEAINRIVEEDAEVKMIADHYGIPYGTLMTILKRQMQRNGLKDHKTYRKTNSCFKKKTTSKKCSRTSKPHIKKEPLTDPLADRPNTRLMMILRKRNQNLENNYMEHEWDPYDFVDA